MKARTFGYVTWTTLVTLRRHGTWVDLSCVIPIATSIATFSNVIVYISRATSCGMNQILVTPRILARLKGIVLGNIIWERF
jgi:hypothetical protein